ncbi:MAG: hypothetical protein DDT21_01191 [Syntrophomonadaceae bacterium]|nr:hypothetical protein [Bacillota bacterium]
MQEKDLLAAILHELKEMKTSVNRFEKGQETLVIGQEALVKGQENLIKQVTAIRKDVAEINYVINQGVFSDIARLEKRIERLEQKAV